MLNKGGNMKGNQKRIFPLTMVLQIFIISFAIMAIPAAAEDLSVPDKPFVLQGYVELDGAFAPVDTIISVELDGQSAGTIIVGNDGEYDNFPVTCSSEDYSNLKFYVNGIEAQLVDATVFDGANAGDIIGSVNLVATSPVSNGGDNNDNSGGSSSYSGTATTSTSDDQNPSEPTASVSSTGDDDTSLKSVAETSQPMGSTDDVPASETKSPIMAIVIGAIVLLGIVVTVVYKLKEN